MDSLFVRLPRVVSCLAYAVNANDNFSLPGDIFITDGQYSMTKPRLTKERDNCEDGNIVVGSSRSYAQPPRSRES